MSTDLSCVGCGRVIVWGHRGGTLAISCYCGAAAPVLIDSQAAQLASPASLVRLLIAPAGQVPHLEYYLGYSDHESEVKQKLAAYLTTMGSISQRECLEERCRTAYCGGRARWKLKSSGDKSASCAWCGFPILLNSRQYLAVGHDLNSSALQCASCGRFTNGYDLTQEHNWWVFSVLTSYGSQFHRICRTCGTHEVEQVYSAGKDHRISSWCVYREPAEGSCTTCC